MSPAVLELATEAWNQGKLSGLPHFSRHEQRAWHRAVLLGVQLATAQVG